VIIVAYFILFPSPLKKLANHQPAEHQAAVRVFLLLLLTRRQSRVCVFLVRGVVVVVVDVEDVVECVGSWIIVVELLLLICTWEFNTKQKLNKKEQAFAFTGLKQYYIYKNGSM
jgi:hypothetical protein